MIVCASILKIFLLATEFFPKTASLFPKTEIPKNGKTGTLFLGDRNAHFTGIPKNRTLKASSPKWLLEKSPYQKANPFILQRQNSLFSLHFFPETELRRTPCSVTDYFQALFTPCMLAIPLFFKAFSPLILHYKNDLGMRIDSHFKVVNFYFILFWGLPRFAFGG